MAAPIGGVWPIESCRTATTLLNVHRTPVSKLWRAGIDSALLATPPSRQRQGTESHARDAALWSPFVRCFFSARNPVPLLFIESGHITEFFDGLIQVEEDGLQCLGE
jgi:hypothetical protein